MTSGEGGASLQRLITGAKNHFSIFLSPAKTFTETSSNR